MGARAWSGRAELTIRVGVQDELFVRRLFGLEQGSVKAAHLPARLVVDAHVPLDDRGARLAATARTAGIPFLIDPETYLLQDHQFDAAPWCRVPFADARAHKPADLSDPRRVDDLVKKVIDYQLDNGASALIAPYVHVDRVNDGWAAVQTRLWRATAEYIRREQIHVPLIAVLAIGWRCLHPLRGVPQLKALWHSLAFLRPDELALAVSKAHMGAHPGDRIAELMMLVRRLAQTHKVTMWQQGILGEVCVVEGAAGYECGIGWREKCDLQSRKTQWRHDPGGDRAGGPVRAVYLPQLGRSVPRKRLELARGKRSLWGHLICPDAGCCSPGGEDLLGDARRHTVVARARDLESLNSTGTTRWRWHQLAEKLADGIALAELMNRLAPRSPSTPEIETETMRALYHLAAARRGRGGSRRSA